MRNEGKGEELGGKIRAGVGKLLGNERMQAEGKAHELKGKAKQAVAKAAEKAESKAREVAVAERRGLDGDDEQVEEELLAQEEELRARRASERGAPE